MAWILSSDLRVRTPGLDQGEPVSPSVQWAGDGALPIVGWGGEGSEEVWE